MSRNGSIPLWKQAYFHNYDKPRKFPTLPRPYSLSPGGPWGATIVSGTLSRDSGTHYQIMLGMDSFITRNERRMSTLAVMGPGDTYPATGWVMEVQDAYRLLSALALAIKQAEDRAS